MKVAILDTGLDPTIKEVRRQVTDTRDFLARERPFWGARRYPYDWNGHGTGVASVISRVAPEADLMIVKVYDEESQKQVPGNWWTASLIEAGIAWAVEHGADVINLSAAVAFDLPRMRALIRFCRDRNVLLVASVENVMTPGDSARAVYPAAYPEVVAVGGVTKVKDRLQVWDHSGLGDFVDVVAPATSVWVERPSYLDWSLRMFPQRAFGNSLATAMVSGTAALSLGAMDDDRRLALKRRPGALCEELRDILCRAASNESLGYDGVNSRSGHGMIDMERAVRLARHGSDR